MATLEQLPGLLNISLTPSDDLSVRIAFTSSSAPFPLTGYTFAAVVEHAGTSTSLAVANTDLAGGIITLSLTDAQAEAIGYGVFKWYLEWTTGTTTRRALAGNFELRYQE